MSYYSSENYFWLNPGETQLITVNILWRDGESSGETLLSAHAWNAKEISWPIETKTNIHATQ